jgi:hypothetical protein
MVRWVPRRSSWAASLALGLVWVDLVAVNMPLNLELGLAALRVYDGSWLETAMKDEGLYRTANEWGLPGNIGCLVRRQDLYGASPLRLQAHKDMMDALPHWRLWQLFGVRYVATWEHDCPAPYPCYRIAMQGEEWAKNTVYLHRIEDEWPRAWIVHRARRVEDKEALALLSDPAFDPFQEALLAEVPDVPWSLGIPDNPSTGKVAEWSPERIVVLGDLEEPGWLVVGEWDYPGWIARVDGRPTAIYRAHYGLRAVPLAAGKHKIEFLYRPTSLYAGAALSLLTLLGTVVGLVALRRQRGDS